MPRIVHFEIHADDPERAMKFYRACFGWEFNRYEGPFDYWLITTGPKEEMGIDGGLLKRTTPISGEGVIAYVCTMAVEDLDATIGSVEKNGGTITMAKDVIPGVGWLSTSRIPKGILLVRCSRICRRNKWAHELNPGSGSPFSFCGTPPR